RGNGIELQFIADTRDELDLHLAAIKIPVEIEEMNFEKRRPVIDRRARAKAGDGRKGPPVDPRDDGINAMRKPVGRLKRDIGRRHAKRAPQALARNHLARNQIVATESGGRGGEIAALESVANGARGDNARFALD